MFARFHGQPWCSESEEPRAVRETEYRRGVGISGRGTLYICIFTFKQKGKSRNEQTQRYVYVHIHIHLAMYVHTTLVCEILKRDCGNTGLAFQSY